MSYWTLKRVVKYPCCSNDSCRKTLTSHLRHSEKLPMMVVTFSDNITDPPKEKNIEIFKKNTFNIFDLVPFSDLGQLLSPPCLPNPVGLDPKATRWKEGRPIFSTTNWHIWLWSWGKQQNHDHWKITKSMFNTFNDSNKQDAVDLDLLLRWLEQI